MKNRSLAWAALAALTPPALLAAGCATSTTRTLETDLAQALVSPDQENQIGLQLKTDLDTNQKVVYMTDPTVVNYVRATADKVIALGKRDRPEVQWQVFVIDDRKTVNAFATPGGYLYVYRGLLEMANNEAELAGVMAHETGHVVARHAARSLVESYGLDAVVAMAAGNNPGLVTKLTASVATNGLMLQHSRADETEADEYGARYAGGAGYDPRGLISFFTRLKAQVGDVSGLGAYLSDHPATQERIDHLNAYIAAQHIAGANLGAAPYAGIKQRLAVLPTATPAPSGSSARPVAPPPSAPPPAAPPPH
ncbi:MAG TPA: M48 family metallopeptidase [Polyangia bacterium]|jgi:predicted Zn-dependent protease